MGFRAICALILINAFLVQAGSYGVNNFRQPSDSSPTTQNLESSYDGQLSDSTSPIQSLETNYGGQPSYSSSATQSLDFNFDRQLSDSTSPTQSVGFNYGGQPSGSSSIAQSPGFSYDGQLSDSTSPTQSLGTSYGGNTGYANNNYGSYRTKPGQCPISAAAYISCLPGTRSQCSSDNNCRGAQKCCLTGCARTCVNPQRQQPPNTGGTRPGTCPYVPPGTIGTCIAGCGSDDDCASSQKCCTNGCGRICKNVSQQVLPIILPTPGYNAQPQKQPYRKITPIQNGGFNAYGKK